MPSDSKANVKSSIIDDDEGEEIITKKKDPIKNGSSNVGDGQIITDPSLANIEDDEDEEEIEDDVDVDEDEEEIGNEEDEAVDSDEEVITNEDKINQTEPTIEKQPASTTSSVITTVSNQKPTNPKIIPENATETKNENELANVITNSENSHLLVRLVNLLNSGRRIYILDENNMQKLSKCVFDAITCIELEDKLIKALENDMLEKKSVELNEKLSKIEHSKSIPKTATPLTQQLSTMHFSTQSTSAATTTNRNR